MQATEDNGGKVDLTLSGNLTVYSNDQINVTSQFASQTKVVFLVEGDSGTVEFVNITIPKSAVSYGKAPTVSLVNQQVQSQSYSQDDANYYVWVTIPFGSYYFGDLTIAFSTTSTQNNSLIIFGVLAAVFVIVIASIIFWYRRKKQQ